MGVDDGRLEGYSVYSGNDEGENNGFSVDAKVGKLDGIAEGEI